MGSPLLPNDAREVRLLFHVGWSCGMGLGALTVWLGFPPLLLAVVSALVMLVRMYQLGGEVRK